MNRFLQAFNLLGVAVLIILCAGQWRVNSRLIQEADKLEHTRRDQVAKIIEQSKTLDDDQQEMESLRQRLSISESTLEKTQIKLSAAESQRDTAIAQRDGLAKQVAQLKTALDKYADAVAQRDAVIKKAADEIGKQNDQIRQLAKDHDDAVTKFNDLVLKFNALVAQVNGAQTRP